MFIKTFRLFLQPSSVILKHIICCHLNKNKISYWNLELNDGSVSVSLHSF